MNEQLDCRLDCRVATARVGSRGYQRLPDQEDEVALAIERLSTALGWGSESRGPFGALIPDGANVLIKPNFVLHYNQNGGGLDHLLTHSSLVQNAARAALRSGAASVLVGDAPLQSCDFSRLLEATGLDRWAEELKSSHPRFKGIQDFRRTTCTRSDGVRVAEEDVRPAEHFVLFDLAEDSLLEPVTDRRRPFRVTNYDPRLMARTHSYGIHRYLIAREVLEADVVMNLPKLKTHKKAGITCALKNLIGINGNKEYLPHHRIGGAGIGGDCYPGRSPVKRTLEYSLDRQNTSRSTTAAKFWNGVATNLDRLSRLSGDRLGVEGSWSGNDTIWRTCLDLNRILLFGRSDGTLSRVPQRRVIHLVDAVIAGSGEGPLSPDPLELGLILGGQSGAAVDWVAAMLLGYDPLKIPIVRNAFEPFRYCLTAFSGDHVRMIGDLGDGAPEEVLTEWTLPESMTYPRGWLEAVRPGRPCALKEDRRFKDEAAGTTSR